MKVMDEFYPMLQDLLLQIREIRKGEKEICEEIIEQWEEDVKEMDEIVRQRLFILTIAAEEGWQTATEVAFRKKGECEAQSRGNAFSKDMSDCRKLSGQGVGEDPHQQGEEEETGGDYGGGQRSSETKG